MIICLIVFQGGNASRPPGYEEEGRRLTSLSEAAEWEAVHGVKTNIYRHILRHLFMQCQLR